VAGQKPPASRSLTVVRDVPYREGPSTRWRLDLAMKKDPHGKARPAIVVIHGGGWLEGDRSSFASRKHGVPGNIEDFAELGFIAVAINYRLSGEAPFPAALEDCKCAVRWLRAHAGEYGIDTKHIGAYGNSAGGHLALLLGLVGKDAGLEGMARTRNIPAPCRPWSAAAAPSTCSTSTGTGPSDAPSVNSWAVRRKARGPPSTRGRRLPSRSPRTCRRCC
jgi:acetyl esterase/lipase